MSAVAANNPTTMSRYTSTREGFQEAMVWALTGPPEEAKTYVEATTTSTFFHVMNRERPEHAAYLESIEKWRARTSDYSVKIHEFLRDDTQLAARMSGRIKVDGTEVNYESFLFAKVDTESGKMVSLIERAVWPGP